MKCTECGKEISISESVKVDDLTFCNNLCRHLWSKKNPGAISSSSEWKYQDAAQSQEIERVRNSPTKRIVLGLIWFIVMYFLAIIIAGVIIGGIAGVENPENAEQAGALAAKVFVQKWGLIILGATALFSILATIVGLLPGTAAWKRIKRPPEGMSYCPFGAFSSIVFTLLLVCAMIAPMAIGAGVMAFKAKQANPELSVEVIKKSIENSGNLWSKSIVVSFFSALPLILLLILTRGKRNLPDYIGFKGVPWLSLIKWIVMSLAIMTLLNTIAFLTKNPIVPENMIAIYKSAKFIWIFAIGIIILAPIYEEVLFRGFLFKGLLASRLGPIGAVMIPGLFWAMIHFQYDAGQIVGIFIFGVFLGLARLNSKSILTPIAMHIFWNFGAFLEIAYFAHRAIK